MSAAGYRFGYHCMTIYTAVVTTQPMVLFFGR